MDKRLYRKYAVLLIIPILMMMVACGPQEAPVQGANNQEEIRIVTTYGPTTYFVDTDSETGFEYEMARMFAEHLGRKLKVIIAANKSEMIDVLTRGEADIAVGLIKGTFAVNDKLQAGPEYYDVTQQVIYKIGVTVPDTFYGLSPFPLHIARGGIRPEKLSYIKRQVPDFSWKLHPELNSSDIIELMEADQIAYAAVYSNEFLLAQQSYPELRVAFDISEPTPLAWFIRKSPDNTLLNEIEEFFDKINEDENLAELVEYFFGTVQKFDYVDQRRFISRFSSRLPQYEALFKEAANALDFDWRMLAAMSYQESHWNERARSPTGVRGLMMLTLTTAKQVGVSNRLDPEQSIMGGAHYINQMVNRIPERIENPDRMWFALAAYNIGLGHVEDARIITEKQGGNPDKWQDVKDYLPYLQNSKFYKQTLYGYARGNEAVSYVESIRKYYNTLIHLTHEEPVPDPPAKKPLRLVEVESMVF